MCVTAKRKERRKARRIGLPAGELDYKAKEEKDELCVTAKGKGRRKAEEKTRKEGDHID